MRISKNRFGMLGSLTSSFSVNIPPLLSKSDNNVESTVKQSYVYKNFLEKDNIKMQFDDGVVTLTGTVSEKYHKLLALEIFSNLRGIVKVNDRLEEINKFHSAYTDEWIITNVKSALRFHQNLRTSDLEIISKDGNVTLRGKAKSLEQKKFTTEYVEDVEGVKKVKNEMTVQNEIIMGGCKTTARKIEVIKESIDDLSITALVKTTLFYHRSMSALEITVETKNGVVKLDGKAGNWTEKNLAGKIALDVYGVKMVFNNMIIERTAAIN